MNFSMELLHTWPAYDSCLKFDNAPSQPTLIVLRLWTLKFYAEVFSESFLKFIFSEVSAESS